ncbi:MAG: hypothetical protein P4M08_04895 [Oligoflexia bacterium]|nr:hypothetical protein [Oligoflexia bacterium]
MTTEHGELERIARESLQKNIHQLGERVYLSAGAHQFKSLWTRDFCWASRGLFALNRADVVRSHLEALIECLRPSDGLVPRVMDCMSPRLRVAQASFWSLFGVACEIPLRAPIAHEYQDEHGTEAIDSNILVLLTALDYLKNTGDTTWWNQRADEFTKIYRFYDTRRDPADGLIVQPKFSDWQDSVTRIGKAFYTNLLYYIVSARLVGVAGFDVSVDALRILRASILVKFFDSRHGIFRSLYQGEQASPYFSLDGNLLALDLGFFKTDEENAALYEKLRKSPLWEGSMGWPGANTFPDYPRSWRSFAVRLAGVGHYHDRIYWSWLIALSAKIAKTRNDLAEYERIVRKLAELAARDRAIVEVYAPKSSLPPYRSWLYRSETPFSWGAAFVLDALRAV